MAYLNAFLSVVALAYKDGILQNDITADVKRIHCSLPLSPSATRLLRTISRDSPRVFPGLTEFMLNKEVPLLMEKAKIDKHITFHCFRHSFAMALLNKGTDIYTIAKLMGHRSVTSTQVYAKLSDEQLRKAILKL